MTSAVTRVLVADDVRDSADTLAALLGSNGFDARAVYDGRDALTVAGLWRPDGAILDLSLPGLSGYEVARELRRLYGRQIRLVAYTGWGSPNDRDRCIQAGFDGFLVKPADPEQLLGVMGHATADLVRKSIDASIQQVRRQIDLGHSLLATCDLAPPARTEAICALVERAVLGARDKLVELPLGPEERRDLTERLKALEARIALARARSAAAQPGSGAPSCGDRAP